MELSSNETFSLPRELWHMIALASPAVYHVLVRTCSWMVVPEAISRFTTRRTVFAEYDEDSSESDNDVLTCNVCMENNNYQYMWVLPNGDIHVNPEDANEPSALCYCGAKYWYYHGNRHRDGDLPALDGIDEIIAWYHHGKHYIRPNGLPNQFSYHGVKWIDAKGKVLKYIAWSKMKTDELTHYRAEFDKYKN